MQIHNNMNAKNKANPIPHKAINTVVDYSIMKKSNDVIRAINHKLRQQIIELIFAHRKMTVTEIYKKLHLMQSVTSQHLAILRKAGILTSERNGKNIYYAINLERINKICELSKSML